MDKSIGSVVFEILSCRQKKDYFKYLLESTLVAALPSFQRLCIRKGLGSTENCLNPSQDLNLEMK